MQALAAGDPAALFKKVSDELTEKQKEVGLDKANGVVGQLEEIKTKVAQGPNEIMTMVMDAVKHIMESVEEAISNPASLIPGGGALAACASYYAKAVMEKLKSFKAEVEKLLAMFGKLAESAKATFSHLGESLTKVMESVGKAMKSMMDLPKQLQEEAGKLHSPADVSKVDLSSAKAALDVSKLTSSLGDLGHLKAALGPAIAEIKEGIEKVTDFVSKAPDMVKNCFIAPAPLCMMNMADAAPAPMKAMLEKVEMLKKVDLHSLSDTLGKTHESMGNLDEKQVKDPMEHFSTSALEKLKPLEHAIEAAKMTSGHAGIIGKITHPFG